MKDPNTNTKTVTKKTDSDWMPKLPKLYTWTMSIAIAISLLGAVGAYWLLIRTLLQEQSGR